MAEREGFEPSETCASAVFKTAALNHSTISPVLTKLLPDAFEHQFCHVLDKSCRIFDRTAF